MGEAIVGMGRGEGSDGVGVRYVFSPGGVDGGVSAFASQIPYLHGAVSTRGRYDVVVAWLEADLFDGGLVLGEQGDGFLGANVDDLARLIARGGSYPIVVG